MIESLEGAEVLGDVLDFDAHDFGSLASSILRYFNGFNFGAHAALDDFLGHEGYHG